MAASTITRDTWTNDTGSAAVPNADGTVINNAALQNNVYARIDAMFAGAGAYATFTLGGKLTVEGFGQQNFSAGGTGDQRVYIRNTTAGTGNTASLAVADNSGFDLSLTKFSSTYTPATYKLANGGALLGEGAGGLSIVTTNAAGTIRFYTNSTPSLRWGINAAGDFTFGASEHIADSAGTPTIASGFGAGSPTITGTDYAFRITTGAGGSAITGVVTFGHVWTSAPVCVACCDDNVIIVGTSSTTNNVSIFYSSSTGHQINVICRGS